MKNKRNSNTWNIISSSAEEDITNAAHNAATEALRELGPGAAMRLAHALLFTFHSFTLHRALPDRRLKNTGEDALRLLTSIIEAAGITHEATIHTTFTQD